MYCITHASCIVATTRGREGRRRGDAGSTSGRPESDGTSADFVARRATVASTPTGDDVADDLPTFSCGIARTRRASDSGAGRRVPERSRSLRSYVGALQHLCSLFWCARRRRDGAQPGSRTAAPLRRPSRRSANAWFAGAQRILDGVRLDGDRRGRAPETRSRRRGSGWRRIAARVRPTAPRKESPGCRSCECRRRRRSRPWRSPGGPPGPALLPGRRSTRRRARRAARQSEDPAQTAPISRANACAAESPARVNA